MASYGAYSSRVPFNQLPDPTPYYDLLETIGEGTYGEVYVAESKATGAKVAVKVLEISNDIMEEIEEEYMILSEFGGKHPNLPQFFGVYLKPDVQTDQLWFVIELCAGGSVTDIVKKLLEKHRKLDEDAIAYILKETLEGLAFLHAQNVIHRDIKGQNILLTDQAHIKLVDFGVAAHLRTADGKRNTSVGTPYFMAPEVIACEQQLDSAYDTRSDVWSLGIVAIELADGEPPNANLHPMRALFKIPRSPPPTVKNPKEWSAVFMDFIKQCLIKDYDKRPSPQELLRHPFILQVPADPKMVQQRLRNLLVTLHGRIPHKTPARMLIVTTKRGKLKTNRKSKLEVVYGDDLAALEVLDENIIVDHLYNRFTKGQVYTYVGDILIAINPFSAQNIYTEETRNLYFGCAKADNPPHIFGISDSVYHSLLQLAQNQCIVISGESGSGKTESAKHLVQHLAHLGRAANKSLEQKVLMINPVMEAFGNAKTGINDNSSRFGKYLEMIFAPTGKVVGANLSEYLLEKGRVVSQAPAERNFHVLYYVYDGLGRSETLPEDSYQLRPTHRHRYLSGYAGDNHVAVSAHRERFMELHKSLNTLGFKIQELTSMYRVLAAVLHLGDIQFSTKEVKHMADRSVVSNPQVLTTVSKLLGVDSAQLRDALTTEMVVTRGESILRSHTVNEARNVRDSLAKALYGRLFDWIVNKMNQMVNPTNAAEQDGMTIGILDIFGFENFTQNSFEQLCINITNEQLQYFFNHSVFTWEQKEYAEEGLDWVPINFWDNRPILDLFLSKPVGLLALLDEESRFPKATDHSLAEKFHQNMKSASYQRNKIDIMKFTVEHYAGKIEYDVHGFLEKNRDYLAAEVIQLMRTSDVHLMRILFQNPLTKTGNLYEATTLPDKATLTASSLSITGSVGLAYPKPIDSKNHNKRLRTLASQTRAQQSLSTYFRYSLMDLLTKIVSSSPHFIRCIKPNDQKLPNFYASSKVRQQLLYAGILETARIRREGFAFRILFAEFIMRRLMFFKDSLRKANLSRLDQKPFHSAQKVDSASRVYHILVFSHEEHYNRSGETCRTMLQRLKLEGWAIGRTKVFLKYYHLDILSKLLKRLLDAVILVQANSRRWMARKRYLAYCKLRHLCATTIQRVFRGWIVRKRYKELQERRIAAAQPKPLRRHVSRKRPCISPLNNSSDSEQRLPKARAVAESSVLPQNFRGPKRSRDTTENDRPKVLANASLDRSNLNANGRSHSEDSPGPIASFTSASFLPQNSIDQENIQMVLEPSKRPRVRDFIAVFERSNGSDTSSESSCSRSPSWKNEKKVDHSIERIPIPRVPLRNIVNELPNERPSLPKPSPVQNQPKAARSGEPRIHQFPATNLLPHPPMISAPKSAPATVVTHPSPSPHPAHTEDNAALIYRKILKKSNWDPAQTLSKSYVPVGQVDFRSVLRNNRK